MDPVKLFALLCTVFILKHYLADFLFQTRWMAEGKEAPSGWILPLAAHSAWHGGLTAAIVLVMSPRLWWLAAADFIVHAAIDRSKGLAVAHWNVGRFTDGRWWWIFGADQTLHQLTHLVFAWMLAA